jgi:hypothetical protein
MSIALKPEQQQFIQKSIIIDSGGDSPMERERLRQRFTED